MSQLGSRQLEVLLLLQANKGVWHEKAGWVYETPSETVEVLDSLVARGLVRKGVFEETDTYALIDAGREVLAAENPPEPEPGAMRPDPLGVDDEPVMEG